MPYTYLLPLPQPPTTSLDPFEQYASSNTTIFMNFFQRCFINFSKLKHECENVSPLITCSITPINHHGIFSIVNHFSRSHILIMLLALQQFLPGLFSMETFFSHHNNRYGQVLSCLYTAQLRPSLLRQHAVTRTQSSFMYCHQTAGH